MSAHTSAAAPIRLALLQFSIAYLILYAIKLLQHALPDPNSALCYGNALGIAYLVHLPRARMRPILLCAAAVGLLVRLAAGQLDLGGAATVLSDLAEMCLGAVLLRKWSDPGGCDANPAALARLFLLGCTLTPLLGASVATLAASPPDWPRAADVWTSRYLDGMVGAAALLPLASTLLRDGWRALRSNVGPHAWQGAALLLLLPAGCLGALNYLSFPFVVIQMPLTLLALRLNFAGCAALVWLTVMVVTTLLSTGLGLPATVSAQWSASLIHLPLLAILVPPLLLASSVNAGRRAEARRLAGEQALAANHRRLQTIIDQMPAMIGYWDRDLRNGFGNRAYLEWFGLTPEQMRGRHIRDVIGAQRYALNLPFIEQALAGQTPLFERTIVDAAGVTRHTLASYVPDLSDGAVRGFYAFVTDISQLKRAQRQELESRTRLQAIIDAASEFAIIAAGADGVISLFNTGAERMLGYSAGQLVGRYTPRRLLLRAELEGRATLLAAQLRRPVAGLEALTALPSEGQADEQCWQLRCHDGRLLPVRLVVTPMVDADGRCSGFLGIATDITRQRQLEVTLVKAKEMAEAASLAKSEFVANMSHEIRTPLNGVLGLADLLDTPALAPEQRNYVAMLRNAGRSLLSILNDILDFEKIGAGRMELVPRPFRLDDLLATLSDIMAVSGGAKRLDLALGVAPGVPTVLVGDAGRLQQVLLNLLGNAIKFTEHGEVGLLILPEPVDGAGIRLRFIVHDSGIGIDAAQQARLFQPFSQADSSISRRYGGSGLGLMISRQLVELMAGQISLHSTPGAGSTFTVALPFPPPPEDEVHALRGARLLVVGSPRTSRHYLCQTLAARRVDVDCSDDLDDAARRAGAAVAAGVPYAAVLIDDAGGADAAMQRLRERAAAPLLLLVEHGAPGQQSRLRQVDAVLVKPLTLPSLLGALRQASVAASGDAQPPLPAAALPLAGVQVLLVEDVELNQLVARSMLERAGASVVVAGDGRQALACLRAAPQRYTLVLMDVHMPEMDGFSAAIAIRAELGLTLPVLAMTAGVTRSEQQRCLAAGMDDVIAKPVESAALLAAIARCLPAPSQRQADDADGGAAIHARLDELMALGAGDAPYQQQIIVLLEHALAHTRGELAGARQAWRAGRADAAAQGLHALRGTLGAFGAQRFTALSLALERDLDGMAGALDAERFDQLDAALAPLLRALAQWLGARSAA